MGDTNPSSNTITKPPEFKGMYRYQNISYPLKKKPFFFHRWMMRLFFGIEWITMEEFNNKLKV